MPWRPLASNNGEVKLQANSSHKRCSQLFNKCPKVEAEKKSLEICALQNGLHFFATNNLPSADMQHPSSFITYSRRLITESFWPALVSLPRSHKSCFTRGQISIASTNVASFPLSPSSANCLYHTRSVTGNKGRGRWGLWVKTIALNALGRVTQNIATKILGFSQPGMPFFFSHNIYLLYRRNCSFTWKPSLLTLVIDCFTLVTGTF